ncbi:hypothetical protein [Flavobacterium caeni]|uniref:DUF4468 domain-containing protein n=1 Tax=Flavobacterium caeni TaxID=490189 RepID=A0A1G5H526_9FLAO|nr:hypothetical protein [Flavobacterium caeni]SCY58629.1 hypothetical protein SAMN02927903_01761 [Flavobacterium caeni]
MKNLIGLLLLLPTTVGFAQHAITLNDGKIVWAKTVEIGPSSVNYLPYLASEASEQSIDKKEVFSIKMQDGTVEIFDWEISNASTREQLQQYIANLINTHGSEKEVSMKYRASWQGHYLQLELLDRNGNPESERTYDFASVHRFQNVSKRALDWAYLNVFVAVAQNKKKTKWDTEKLIMRIDDFFQAERLLEALRKYNALFKPDN